VEMRFAILVQLSTQSVHCSSSDNCVDNELRIEIVWTIGIGKEDIVDVVKLELANHGQILGAKITL